MGKVHKGLGHRIMVKGHQGHSQIILPKQKQVGSHRRQVPLFYFFPPIPKKSPSIDAHPAMWFSWSFSPTDVSLRHDVCGGQGRMGIRFQPSDRDLWPWPLNLSEILSSYILTPNFVSLCQTVWLWERRLTEGTDSITSTADTGGKELHNSQHVHIMIFNTLKTLYITFSKYLVWMEYTLFVTCWK